LLGVVPVRLQHAFQDAGLRLRLALALALEGDDGRRRLLAALGQRLRILHIGPVQLLDLGHSLLDGAGVNRPVDAAGPEQGVQLLDPGDDAVERPELPADVRGQPGLQVADLFDLAVDRGQLLAAGVRQSRGGDRRPLLFQLPSTRRIGGARVPLNRDPHFAEIDTAAEPERPVHRLLPTRQQRTVSGQHLRGSGRAGPDPYFQLFFLRRADVH
jgi:hypothetical protein